MDKEFLGQPAWIWAVGAVVVVGGYLYLRHQSAKSGASGAAGSGSAGGGGGGGHYKSTSTFHETVRDLQSHPRRVR